MSDPTLNQGEVIIRKEGGMEYVSMGRNSAWLYLTNQRIIVKRFIGGIPSYPLSHMTKADVAEYQPSPLALINYKLLRVSFDNGGAILFGLGSDKSAWIQSIEQAKVNAPDLPYTTAPPEFTGRASPKLFQWVAIFTAIVGCLIATCTLALIVFTFLLSKH